MMGTPGLGIQDAVRSPGSSLWSIHTEWPSEYAEMMPELKPQSIPINPPLMAGILRALAIYTALTPADTPEDLGIPMLDSSTVVGSCEMGLGSLLLTAPGWAVYQ
jgi:hypothetical protein